MAELAGAVRSFTAAAGSAVPQPPAVPALSAAAVLFSRLKRVRCGCAPSAAKYMLASLRRGTWTLVLKNGISV